VAKKRSALTALQDQFRGRETGKTYAALVQGRWPANRKVIDVALHKFLTAEGERRVRPVDADHDEGRRSITLVKVVKPFAAFTLLDVTIKTGRTHQIRVHLANEGHPIAGDAEVRRLRPQQGRWPGRRDRRASASTACSSCPALRFRHPASGETVELESPLPAECKAVLEALQ
jgi:23S rRNA pseudouridine955/2504/2580 synthase